MLPKVVALRQQDSFLVDVHEPQSVACMHHSSLTGACADRYVQKRRKKLGSDTGKSFAEGWVEFLNKADAKQVSPLPFQSAVANMVSSSHASIVELISTD